MGEYGRRFHDRRNGKPHYRLMAEASLATSKWSELGKYNSVLDVGCSCGALLAQMSVPIKFGIDHNVPSDTFHAEAGTYVDCDLSINHVNLAIGFDLIVCQEIAEHLPQTSSCVLDTISCNARLGGTLVFSAAKPGQRGRHHVNCQPSWHWLELLGKYGWRFHAPMTNTYIADIGNQIPECYRSNTMIFVKKM